MGTAAVILLVAVGGGISNQVQGQIGKLGTNAIYILNERTTGGQDRGATNARQIQLTPQDVRALEDKTRAPSVARVTPGASATGTLTWNGTTYPLGTFLGVEPAFGEIRNLVAKRGRWLSDADQADHAKVPSSGPRSSSTSSARPSIPSARPSSSTTSSSRSWGFSSTGDPTGRRIRTT